MKMSGLVGAEVRRSGGADLGTCIDVLVDTEAGRVVYAFVDKGPATNLDHALYSRDKMKVVDGALELDVSDEEISAAHERVGEEDEPGPAMPLDLSSMPPLVVGPFGYTVAPTMAGAVANAYAESSRHEARPEIGEGHGQWHWFANLRGLPVFSERGELGKLSDIIVNPDGLFCVTLMVTTDHGEIYALDFAKLRMVSRDEKSVVLDLEKTPPYSVERIRDEMAER